MDCKLGFQLIMDKRSEFELQVTSSSLVTGTPDIDKLIGFQTPCYFIHLLYFANVWHMIWDEQI
jgi:hypothetical protein